MLFLSFVVNGVSYSGVKGDDAKRAAKELFAKGESIDPYHSYISNPDVSRDIQRELEKLKYTASSPFPW